MAKAPGRRVTIVLPAAEVGRADIVVSPTVGKTAIRFSLQTGDPALAKRRQSAALEQVGQAWDAMRGGPVALSPRRRVAFAGLIYKRWREALTDDPVLSAEKWKAIAAAVRHDLESGQTNPLVIPAEDAEQARQAAVDYALDGRFGTMTDLFLSQEGIEITQEGRAVLLLDVARAMIEQAEQAALEAGGDYGPDVNALRFPAWERPAVVPAGDVPTFESLFADYERLPGKFGKRREKTIAEYRKTFSEEFAAFVKERGGHADPSRVVRADIVAWRDKLLADGLAPKTIKDKKIAALKAVFARAAKDAKLSANPAEEVDIPVPRPVRERERGFTEDEARQILTAARDFIAGKHGAELVAAIRWAPWIGAYTGARISEITQLRGVDFRKTPEGWFIRFTPEAGGIKSDQYRDVPIHEHLVQLGLVDFAKEAGQGPLFYRPDNAEKASLGRANAVAGRISEWVRKTAMVEDKRVQPTHGWRHRFKTVARAVGMDSEARDYIQGHTIKGMGGVYGDMAGLHREIAKLPRLVI